MTILKRKRLIPDECVCLYDDNIKFIDNNSIITTWNTLHPKLAFNHGCSYYVMNEGWKISRFFDADNNLLYIYCDIIDTSHTSNSNTQDDEYIFTDLLADVIIENDGSVRIVDLDELAEACKKGIISNDLLVATLYKLNNLLEVIYNGKLKEYTNFLDSHIE